MSTIPSGSSKEGTLEALEPRNGEVAAGSWRETVEPVLRKGWEPESPCKRWAYRLRPELSGLGEREDPEGLSGFLRLRARHHKVASRSEYKLAQILLLAMLLEDLGLGKSTGNANIACKEQCISYCLFFLKCPLMHVIYVS